MLRSCLTENTINHQPTTPTTAFAAGQMLGPLVGGGLMDALPNVEEIGCRIEGRTVPKAPEDGGPCLSSFPWVSAVWGAVGLATWVALVACMLGERVVAAVKEPGAGEGIAGAIARRYRRFKSMGQPPPVVAEDAEADEGPIPLPPSLQLSGGPSMTSYHRPSSGLGRRPMLVVTRSALGARGRTAALSRSGSAAVLSRSRHSERSLPYSIGSAGMVRSAGSANSMLSGSCQSDYDGDGRCLSPPPQLPPPSQPQTR